MLTISVDVSGMRRRFETLATAVKHLEPALEIFDAYFSARDQQRFASEGPSWAPRKQETKSYAERAHSLAMHQVERKLVRELRRARHGVDPQRYARRYFVLQEFKRIAGGGSAKLSTVGQLSADERSTLKDRGRLLRELRTARKEKNAPRAAAMKAELENFDFKNRDVLDRAAGARTLKSVTGLSGRITRAEERGRGKILGGLARAMRSKIKKGTYTRYSAIPWAGVHNEGGQAGHGAAEPERRFVFLEEVDAEVLVEILLNLELAALTGG